MSVVCAPRFLARAVLAFCLAFFGASGCNRPALSPNASRTPAALAPASYTAPGGVRLESAAAASGVSYSWPQQPRPMRNLEAFGAGCAFFDYDDDGWQDLLLVGAPYVALYRNQRDGRFENVSQKTGLVGCTGDWKGVAVGDYDGDGFLDLLLTGYRRLALLKNDSGARWLDRTAAAGLDPANRGHWGSSAGFMDLDADGTLDLVVLNYVVFGPKEKQYCEFGGGARSGCPPDQYRPEFAELWRNLGNGRFQDVSAASGLKNTRGKALVLAFADLDGDRRVDFYIGNDGIPAELMRNEGNLRFSNIGVSSGAAFGAIPGRAIAAMGADWADFDRDGRLDLTLTAFSDEAYSLLRNAGGGQMEHVGDSLGITGPTFKPLGFGAKWLDVDNDGWTDILYANGHVYDSVERFDPISTFRQSLMLFHNQEGRSFIDRVPDLGPEVGKLIVGRGSATGDCDNDGRIDMLVVDYEGEPLLLKNRSETGNHWLTLDLRSPSRNRFAYGARLTAKAGKQVWTAQVSPASSYLSSSDPRVHLGLGATTMLDILTVDWPSGRRQVLRNVPADRIGRLEEGQGIRWSPAAAPVARASAAR